MTYSAGQVVEVCSERSRGWTSGFKYGSKVTLEKLIPSYEGYAGRWEAVTATGVRGIISEEDFRPVPEHSPVRTETVPVRRLEPGVYGPLKVGAEISVLLGAVNDRNTEREIEAYLTTPYLNASDWRELARVALELAEYLENA